MSSWKFLRPAPLPHSMCQSEPGHVIVVFVLAELMSSRVVLSEQFSLVLWRSS